MNNTDEKLQIAIEAIEINIKGLEVKLKRLIERQEWSEVVCLQSYIGGLEYALVHLKIAAK